MTRSLLAVSVLVAVASCTLADADVRGSGQPGREARKVASFSEISLAGSMALEVTVGPATSVVVTGDANVVPLVRTAVRGDRLLIDTRESYSSQQPLVVRVTTPRLTALASSGSGDSTVRGTAGANLDLLVSGSGEIDAAGRTERLVARVTGSGAIEAAGLTAAQARASVSGSGDIELTVTEALDASVSGSGRIRYRGNPAKIARRVSGSGDIDPR